MLRATPKSILCVLAFASVAHAAPGDKAAAQMKDRDGKVVGVITLTETSQGILLTGTLAQLPPGAHGFHLHGVGKCEPPFTSAAGHFNPDGKKHGFLEPAGHHVGDLPNLHVSSDGKVVVDVLVAGLALSDRAKGMLDRDGTAIVLHAKADDYKTDPAGDSGDRIACGVVAKAQ
jgi:superoxide dismutase, Cu-Zn family